MEGMSQRFSLDNLSSESPLSSSPSDGTSTLRREGPNPLKNFPPSTARSDEESDASFSSIEAPLSPQEIDRIHVIPITTEMVDSPVPVLSMKNHPVNQDWTNVPVMDLELKNNTTLPACLYSKGPNAEQVEFTLNSKLSSIDEKEPELNPSALENLDTSGYGFIPDLTTPNSSIEKHPEKDIRKCAEGDQWRNVEECDDAKDQHKSTNQEFSNADTFKGNITSTPLRDKQHGTKDRYQELVPPLTKSQSTPTQFLRMNYLESTPDRAMTSANSSGFFGLSDLENSTLQLKETPKRVKGNLNFPLFTSQNGENPIKADETDNNPPATTVDYLACPASVRSEGSEDGRDAHPHSPVNSPHSSTSGHISDLSDSSFNMSDLFIKQPCKPEGEVQGQTQSQTPDQMVANQNQSENNTDRPGVSDKQDLNLEDMKENIKPKVYRENSDVVQDEFEEILPPASHLSLDSNISTTNSQQRNEESAKPGETYISLIAKALLTKKDRKMMLFEIYDKIMDMYEYYRTTKSEAWRNAVRHNLSVNECFIKTGKADTGRGFFWTIHPACVQQFIEGDFQRREARRKVKDMEDKEAAKAMFASRMGLHFPTHHMYPHHPPPVQHHHGNVMYPHHGYHFRVPTPTDQLQALNHQAEVLNGAGVQPIRGRVPLITHMAMNSSTREQYRYQPYYHLPSSQKQMAVVRPNRKLCDLEEAPPNVTVNSLGLFVRNGPIRR